MFRSRPPPTRWVRAPSMKYRSTFAHPGALSLSIPRNPIRAVGAQVTFTTAPFNTAICCGLESISVLEISHAAGEVGQLPRLAAAQRDQPRLRLARTVGDENQTLSVR